MRWEACEGPTTTEAPQLMEGSPRHAVLDEVDLVLTRRALPGGLVLQRALPGVPSRWGDDTIWRVADGQDWTEVLDTIEDEYGLMGPDAIDLIGSLDWTLDAWERRCGDSSGGGDPR